MAGRERYFRGMRIVAVYAILIAQKDKLTHAFPSVPLSFSTGVYCPQVGAVGQGS